MIRLTKLEICLHSTYSNRYKVNTFLLIKEFFSIFFPENPPPLNFVDFQVFTQLDSILAGDIKLDLIFSVIIVQKNRTILHYVYHD